VRQAVSPAFPSFGEFCHGPLGAFFVSARSSLFREPLGQPVASTRRSLAVPAEGSDFLPHRALRARDAQCIGSCWALMMLTLPISSGPVAAMVLCRPGSSPSSSTPPRWRLRGPHKAARAAVAQARMRLQAQTE